MKNSIYLIKKKFPLPSRFSKFHQLPVLIFLISSSISYSQIPNNGFENWTSMGNYFNPDGWWCTNDSIASGSFYPVTRSTDHYPASVGNYSIRIENNISLIPAWGAYGITWTGDINGSNYPVFPVTGHPNSLTGYYKFFPLNNDTMDVHIRLYKNGTDVSGGMYKSELTASSWTPFSFMFTSYIDADSARIMISACHDNDAPVPHGNSVLYVDNLNFDSFITPGISEPDGDYHITVFPNPAGDRFTIELAKSFKTIEVILSDLSGKILYSSTNTAVQKLEVNTSNFAAGVYLVQIQTEKFIETKKVIISN